MLRKSWSPTCTKANLRWWWKGRDFLPTSLPPLPHSLHIISCPTGPWTALTSSETVQNPNVTPCPSCLLCLPWGSPKGGQGSCERSQALEHRAEETRRGDTPCTPWLWLWLAFMKKVHLPRRTWKTTATMTTELQVCLQVQFYSMPKVRNISEGKLQLRLGTDPTWENSRASSC